MNIVKLRHGCIWSPYSKVTERRVNTILYLLVYIVHSLSITNISICCTIAFKYYPSCRLFFKFSVTVRHEKTGNFSSRAHVRAHTHAQPHTHAPKHTNAPENTHSQPHNTRLWKYTHSQPHTHVSKHTKAHRNAPKHINKRTATHRRL
jgi:hypothetical protein